MVTGLVDKPAEVTLGNARLAPTVGQRQMGLDDPATRFA